MAITFACPCGERLEVDDQYAGVKVSCPTCNAVILAPPRRVVARPLSPTESRERGEDERPRRSNRRTDDDADDRPSRRRQEDDNDDRPARRSRNRQKADPPQSLEGRIFNGSTVGGAVAMLVAVVWFVVGFFAGWVFFYPPILFVIGLVGFIRGLVNRE